MTAERKMSEDRCPCTDGDCRHLASLKLVKETIGKISHDLSQPMMVIKGYLDLLEIGNCGDDVVSLKQVIANVSGQLDTLQAIHVRLKESIFPEVTKTFEQKRGITHDSER